MEPWAGERAIALRAAWRRETRWGEEWGAALARWAWASEPERGAWSEPEREASLEPERGASLEQERGARSELEREAWSELERGASLEPG